MSNLKKLRQRIKTAKNIRQITRAMKLVSAAKLRRAQEKVLNSRTYNQEIQKLIDQITQLAFQYYHPMIEKRASTRKEKHRLIFLVTTDRGLTGSFNNNLIRKVKEFIQNEKDSQVTFICAGTKGTIFCQKQGYTIIEALPQPVDKLSFQDALHLGNIVKDSYMNHQIDAFYLCYNKFYSAIRQEPVIIKLLPLEISQKQKNLENKEILFEPNVKEILNYLLPHYLNILIHQAILESAASEHGARMTAMTSATDNAVKMIDELTIVANRERQAIITEEILEVVAGAEASNQ